MRERVETLAAAQPAVPAPGPAPSTGTTGTVDTPRPEQTTTPKSGSPSTSGEGYANRLLAARRRAKDQIREQEERSE
jgi:hypothetical protein